MAPTRKASFQYDGKKLWDYFMSLGKAATYSRLAQYADKNPQTGKSTNMGVFYAMWRYAFNNPEEAYPNYQKWQMEYGNFPSFKEFCEDIVDHCSNPVANEVKKKAFVEKYING